MTGGTPPGVAQGFDTVSALGFTRLVGIAMFFKGAVASGAKAIVITALNKRNWWLIDRWLLKNRIRLAF